MIYYHNSATPYAVQVAPLLTQKSWNEFADDPVMAFFLVKSDGTVQRFLEGNSYTYSDDKVNTHFLIINILNFFK